ncbi:hypothetical protein WJX72_003310 [[Myrmecia] bisecta]|uniref:Acetyltransferase component of pyruvate dehydrogenase complex n=1 Tax=[Myrmecia] bisecta TaxID=41462 RepID=A0AAW1P9L1_9CHLO
MSQGNIASWKKQEGDEIAAGDVLCEVETDKATMEWEAQEEGFLAKILVPAGTKDVAVGTPVAVTVEDKDDIAAFADYKAGSGGGAKPAEAKSESAEESSQGQGAAAAESGGGEEESGSSGGGGGGGGGDYPAHTVMGLPSLSPTMSTGNIAAWKKKEGEEVAAGDSIAEIETDKATMDWESQDDGFIAKILVPEGTKDVGVGTPVLVFVEDKDSVGAFKDFSPQAAGRPAPKPAAKEKKAEAKAPAPQKPEAEPRQEAPSAPQPRAPSGQRVAASPYAKKLAREAGVDISQATPTGPDGRIVAADVQQLISSGGGKAAPQAQEGVQQAAGGSQSQGEWTDMPNSQIRKITAKRLLEAKQTIPHYYLSVDCRVDKLLALRGQLNEALLASKADGKISVNDFIIKASALALRKVPGVNASWFPDFIRVYHNVDISVAVQAPQGLMVPVLRDADARGLAEISKGVKELATKAKEGKLKPDEFTGGTFTISNLGMYGVTNFAAIINPPQAAILAVGAAGKRVVATSTGGFEEASVMSVTMSCDHRVVDGAMGAQWLQAFRGYIEDPVTMML